MQRRAQAVPRPKTRTRWRATAASVVAAAAAALALAPGHAAAVTTGVCADLSVGPPQAVVTDAQRDAAGLPGWPDGALGIAPRGDGTYDFYGMDAFGGTPRPQRSTLMHGTLDNPLAFGVSGRTQPAGIPSTYQWSGGAPIYRDPASGITLQVLHLERNHSSGPSTFWSEIALATVDPRTGQSTYLGRVVSPELSYETSNAHKWTADLGLPSFVIADHGGVPWFHFYFADFRESKPGVFAAAGLSVAGAPVQEVVDAAKRGTVSPWRKLYGGTWSQPALGGRSDELQPGQPQAWAPRVAHSSELGGYVMVAATGPHDVVLSTSPDGVSNWSPRVKLFSDPSRYDAYMTLVGAGGDPSDLGHDFYLYYTQWGSVTPDWANASLMRRAIHCAPPPPPPVQPPAPPQPPTTPAPPHTPAPKLRPRGLKISAARITFKYGKLRLGVRGRVLVRRGVKRCKGGRVAIGLRLGDAKRARVRVTPRVTAKCGFRAIKQIRLRHAPRRAALTLAFKGNGTLRAGHAKHVHLRIRR